ncbi:MAG: chromosomal replication initiator protein DnaA, partial [Lachnospiraceae bacterium]|nr:chromosomal replication initiator protein DnaA [Lachnospiraceae bacterium]
MQSSIEITEKLKSNWDSIKNTIRNEARITDIAYRTWIDPLTVHKFENNVVTILISDDNSVALSYIVNHYLNFFKVTISEFLDMMVDISFILNKDIINNEETHENDDHNIAEDQFSSNLNYENANLNYKYRFDTFVVGSNNKFAHSAALAVAQSPGTAYNPLFLYGGPGLGKTHLMHSIGHFIMEHDPKAKVLYITSEQFTNEVIESIRSGKQESMS